MKQVEIKELDLLGEQEGNATYSTEINSYSKGRILAYRAKDSVSGNHWHEGKSAAKNPEILLVLKGNLKLEWTTELEADYENSQLLKAPVLIKIYPMVKHRITALEDLIFLEHNSIQEHREDTYYPLE